MEISSYLHILRKHSRLIILGPVLAGLAALVVVLLLPPTYEAEAQLAIVKSGALVNFDPKYRTISEIDSGISDPAARRTALIAIAKSPAMASAVNDKVAARLDSASQAPASLLDAVDVSLTGDLIRIKAKNSNSQQAELIANTWAESYRDRVNDVYGDVSLTPADLQKQLDAAQRDYNDKEKALVGFAANNPINQVTQEISQTQRQLSDFVTLQSKLDHLLADATALRGKMLAGAAGNIQGDTLAALLLEASAFSTWSDLPVNLQIPIDQLSAGSTVSDQAQNLDRLITILEGRRTLVQTELSGPRQKKLNDLQAQLEQASAQKQDLVRARDMSAAALTTIGNKITEVQIAAQSKTSVVSIVSPAISSRSSNSGRLLTVAIASLLGAMVSIGLVLTSDYLDGKIHTVEQIQKTVGLPVFGTLHKHTAKNQLIATADQTDKTFRLLRYRLDSSQPAKVLLVTSVLPLEAKSYVAQQLAIQYARAGKHVTLIVPNTPSFGAQGGSALSKASETPGSPANDMPAMPQVLDGVRIVMPTEAYATGHLESPAFERLLEHLRTTGDIILLDMPPIETASDALVVARLADATVLVVQADSTSRSELLEAKELLQSGGANSIGVIFNQVPAETHANLLALRSPLAHSASANGNGSIPVDQVDRA